VGEGDASGGGTNGVPVREKGWQVQGAAVVEWEIWLGGAGGIRPPIPGFVFRLIETW